MKDQSDTQLSEQSLVFRLRKRAEIRRQITSRKSVQEGKPDRIADLLEEAATELERLQGLGQVPEPPAPTCWCTTCRPITMQDMRFVVCPDCGNKRCPKAHNHENNCTGSNDPGQPGSSWEDVK